MKKQPLLSILLGLVLLGLSGCFHSSEALRDNPTEYRGIIGAVYITKTGFEIYRHLEDKYSKEFLGGRDAYYSLYPSTERGHVNNRYSRLLGEIPKGARLKVVSVVQGVESRKVAFVVKVEHSPDEIMQGEEAVIRAYTEHPSLYVQESEGSGLWELNSRWFYKENE